MKGFYSQAIPMNARITVNYKTDEVLFDYPFKSDWLERYRRVLTTNWKIWVGNYFYVVMLMLFLVSISNQSKTGVITQLIQPILIAYIVVGIPSTMAFVLMFNKRYLSKWFSKISFAVQKKNGYYYYKTEKINANEFVLPLFKNIILKYNVEGDFGDKLDVIEIREHDFKYVKSGKMRVQDDLWKATFKFNEVPKDGFLEIWFI